MKKLLVLMMCAMLVVPGVGMNVHAAADGDLTGVPGSIAMTLEVSEEQIQEINKCYSTLEIFNISISWHFCIWIKNWLICFTI